MVARWLGSHPYQQYLFLYDRGKHTVDDSEGSLTAVKNYATGPQRIIGLHLFFYLFLKCEFKKKLLFHIVYLCPFQNDIFSNHCHLYLFN